MYEKIKSWISNNRFFVGMGVPVAIWVIKSGNVRVSSLRSSVITVNCRGLY